MKTLVLIVVAVIAVGTLLAVAHLGKRWREQRRPHDPIEYYGNWDGYGVPIHLTQRITKEEAEARAARGAAYLIGHFDGQGRLVRDVKMLRGEIFFAHDYTYYPGGSLQRVRTTNADGVATVSDYKEGSWPRFFR